MIRKAFLSDSQEIARLSRQLGYPVNVSQLEERLQYMSNHNDHIVYVMESNHVLSGWIHANVRFLIESPPFVEIAGLVVDIAFRGNGIGKQLVQACEQWAAESGFTKIRVRTNQTRSEAVQFYNRIGFTFKNRSMYSIKKFSDRHHSLLFGGKNNLKLAKNQCQYSLSFPHSTAIVSFEKLT